LQHDYTKNQNRPPSPNKRLLAAHAAFEWLEEPPESVSCHISKKRLPKWHIFQIVAASDKHRQWHFLAVSFVGSVKCDDIPKNPRIPHADFHGSEKCFLALLSLGQNQHPSRILHCSA
jgi:hypothetical protein